MTDDSTSPGGLDETENTETKPNLFEQAEGVDWFLAHLIGHADAYGLSQGVTLTVGGTVITGMLIGGRAYFEGVQKLMLASAPSDDENSLNKVLADTYGGFVDIYPSADGSTKPWDAKPNYIHLRDARYLDAEGHQAPQNGMFWRGKLADVSGFTIGMVDRNR
jgi:hypothetical protein